MHRRSFLRLAALGGPFLAAFPSLAIGGTDRPAAARPDSRVKPAELDEATFTELQALMAHRKMSSAEITRRYLKRIEALDRKGPALNSVIEVNPDALTIAEELDRERRTQGPRGPLHGIPVLIKDNIDTHDRMMTTAGSLALLGSVPPKDSFVARRLRESGAVILGKTNLSEWANFRGRRSTSGWSARGGQTRHPYALDRNPSGSSSGSAVAVSANLCAAAVGTETDGSIVSPASVNGIVGVKPTLGLVSRSGIIPIAHSQDTAGPMTRTVKDAALLLAVLAGTDPEDPATLGHGARTEEDYTSTLSPGALQGVRLGVARSFFGFHSRVDVLMKDALEALTDAGATLVAPAGLTPNPDLDNAELEVLRYEMKADMNAYLAKLGPEARIRTLQEIIDFNEENRDLELRWFGQEELVNSQAKGPLTEPSYLEALATCKRLARTEGIDAAMDKDGLDAIVAPTGAPAHMTDWVLGDHWLGGCSSYPAVAGYPHITVPAGFISGLPVGISFFGRAWTEAKLFRIAYAFEEVSKARRAPRYLATLPG